MGQISLNGMQFYSFHGCNEVEKKTGTWFKVDVSFDYDSTRAEQSDDLLDAINYVEIYNIVANEMNKTSNLIENVAFRIKKEIGEKFSSIQNLKVTIYKINPGVGGQIQSVSFTI